MQLGLHPLFRLTFYLILALFVSGLFWITSIITRSARNLESTFLTTIESMILQRADRFSHQFSEHYRFRTPIPEFFLKHPDERKLCDEKLELMRDSNIRYVYLLWQDPQGRFRFLCDGSSSKSPVMQKFDPDNPQLWQRLYRNGKYRIVDQSQFQGLWKSLLYPIRDGNRTQALLVVDYSIDFLTALHHLITPVQETLRYILLITIGLILFILFQLLMLFIIRNRSIRDPLTGVYNRGALQFLKSSLTMKNYNLLMIDLDHFKRINDNYGHDVGDQALKHSARLLQNLIRRKDYLIRHGGEEFLILQHAKHNPEKGYRLAEKILRTFREHPMRHPSYGEIRLRVSIGLYPSPPVQMNFDAILKKADLALYQAKKSGRDCVMEVREDRSPPSTLSFDDVKRWIEHGRVYCEYQPIFTRDGKRVVKYETLVRLKDDAGNPVYPDRFLPMIWQTNTYVRMTRQVLEQAVETFRKTEMPFSVNLALQDLLDKNIFVLIKEMAEREQQTIARMSIEVLEYHHFDHVDRLEKILSRFKKFGISIILDDFGAGHANFLILQHLPIDEFKIDRQLIIENLNNPKAGKLLHALTTYARETGVKTTAEYIANEEIFRAIQEIPVDYLQGFYLGRPSPRLLDPEYTGELDTATD